MRELASAGADVGPSLEVVALSAARLVVLIAVCAGLSAPASRAQETGGPPPTPEVIPALAFIEVAEIPEETELLQQTLRRLAAAAAVEPMVTKIEGELPGIREQGALELSKANALLAANPTLVQLRDSNAGWTGRLAQLASRRRTLARRAAKLEEEVSRLGGLRDLWGGTLAHARETDAPSEVLATVEANLRDIVGVGKQVRERRGVVLSLLTAVSEQELQASEATERIASARMELRSRLFEPDGQPLWSAIGATEVPASWSRVSAATHRDGEALLEFYTSRKQALVPVAIAFVLAALCAVYVRDRMRRRIAGEHLEGSASVFERPWSAALLVAAFVGAAAFPFAPSAAWDLVGLLLLIPLVRLIMPIVPETARRVFWAFVVFYLIDRLRDTIAPAEAIERMVFCGEMVAGAVLVIALLRPSRLLGIPHQTVPPAVVGVTLRFVVVAFLASVSANVLGYVSFSTLVGDGVLGSIYLAIVAYAACRIGTTLALVVLTSARLSWIGVIRNNSEKLVRLSRRSLIVLSLVLWGLGTLDAFSVRDVALSAAEDLLSTPLEFGTVSVSLGSIFAFPLTLFVAFALSRAIRSLLEDDVYPRITLRRGIGNAVSMTVHYVLLLGGFLVALGAAGIDLTKFTLLAGAFGVGIGFGLQNVVNNFVSGLILLYERPVQVGDHIEIGGLLGEVKRIGIRASTVRTFQGAEVIVPNGNLLSDQLVNWTLSDQHRRVELPVGVAYGNRPSDVVVVLKRVLDREDRILREPQPMVFFRGFGSSSLDFELRFWARDYVTYLALASDVAAAVYDELEQAGIAIPFPQRDLHLKSVDAAAVQKLRGGDIS